MITKVGKNEGQLESDRLGGLHAAAMGEAVHEGDRLQGAGEVRRLVGRDGDADADRPVRRRLGLGRREPAPDRRQGRAPDRPEADPGLQELHPGAEVAGAQHREGRALRDLAAVGPEHAALQHEEGQARSRTSWGVLYSSKYKGKITVPDNPIQIADAALYLSKTKPALGIKDPYELNAAAVQGGRRPAEEAAAAREEVLG